VEATELLTVPPVASRRVFGARDIPLFRSGIHAYPCALKRHDFNDGFTTSRPSAEA
jgi:hypothetical protein